MQSRSAGPRYDRVGVLTRLGRSRVDDAITMQAGIAGGHYNWQSNAILLMLAAAFALFGFGALMLGS
jgi:hypothetical protein